MKKFLALLLAALMLASLTTCLSSCGDDNTIVVGYTLYEPMNYMDGDELVGFDTELAKAVFKDMGYEVTFKEIKWENKYTELNSGAIDCIWNGFTSNGEDDGKARAELVDFSYNYMYNKQVIVAKADVCDTITDAESLKDKFGGVEKGSAGESYLTDNLTGAKANPVTSQMDAMKDLSLGKVDFVVVDEQLAKAKVGKGQFEDLKICETVSGDAEYYAIGFKLGSELTATVNETLEKLAEDGTITKLAKKYGVENTAIIDFADQK